MALPNGFAGDYELQRHHANPSPLAAEEIVDPAESLAHLKGDALVRIYVLRLDRLGAYPVYIVKPDPFELERVYDARTAERVDPLPVERMQAVVDAELVDTYATELHAVDEFNRYYTVDEVPALAATMEGEQPSEIVFSSISGRVLRRTDPLAAWFETAYRSVAVG